MKIRISKPGLLSTLQDLGRTGYLSQAVPRSGVMDLLASGVANKAVGNADDCTVIEFTQSGAAFIAESDLLLALSGGGACLSTGEGRLPSDKPVFVPAGTVLHLKHSSLGSRSYLAVAGGWDVPEVLGSRSTYLTAGIGGLNGRALVQNDVLSNRNQLSPVSQAVWNSLRGEVLNYPKWSIARDTLLPEDRFIIRVIPAREVNWFEEASFNNFLSQPYTVGHNSNRIGYRLEGPVINRAANNELLSTAVTPGTIQVTGDGSLVLLMADCQTTGGYPRIAQVAAVDLPLCAQLQPGNNIRFVAITCKEAEKLYIDFMNNVKKIDIAIGMKYGLI
jgi:antagonist of KipI